MFRIPNAFGVIIVTLVSFRNKMNNLQGGKRHSLGKTSFVEHRTFLHLYHSFLRVWILLVLMFQVLLTFMNQHFIQEKDLGILNFWTSISKCFNYLQALTIIAFRGNLNMQTVKILCSLGLTYFIMKFIECEDTVS